MGHMTKKVPDTTRQDPGMFLLDALLRGSGSAAIEAQEASGQRDAVNSDQLPTKGLIGKERPIWEAMGIKIIEREPGTTASEDSLFTLVELPKGWKKQATGHSMWNEVVDDKGRVRAKFFYKAAFYDRDAFMSGPEPRFSVRRNMNGPREEYDRAFKYQVLDGQNVLFEVTAEKLQYKEFDRDKYDQNEATEKSLRQQCRDWLAENYPDFENPLAYWD
jgi:hypothetical protein